MTPHLNCDTSGRQCILPPSNAGAAHFLQVVPYCPYVLKLRASCWCNVLVQRGATVSTALRTANTVLLCSQSTALHGASQHPLLPSQLVRGAADRPHVPTVLTWRNTSRSITCFSGIFSGPRKGNWHKLAINWTFTCNQQPVWCQICGIALETKSLGSEHGSGTLLEGGAHDANE